MDINVLEWNINQRRGRENRKDIPSWIPSEIIYQEPHIDIAILTEVVTDRNWKVEIEPQFSQNYHVYYSHNTQHKENDVAILINKEFEVTRVESWISNPCTPVDNEEYWKWIDNLNSPVPKKPIPDYLRVDCKIGAQNLTVIGARIHALDYDYGNQKQQDKIMEIRKNEFQFLLNQTVEIKNPIIITGDFNNNRRNTPVKIWNLNELKKLASMYNFTLYTPDGSSINKTDSNMPEDHFLLKSLNGMSIIKSYQYDRDFTSKHKEEYDRKRNFIGDLYPNPDHAMLKGILQFEENHSSNNY